MRAAKSLCNFVNVSFAFWLVGRVVSERGEPAATSKGTTDDAWRGDKEKDVMDVPFLWTDDVGRNACESPATRRTTDRPGMCFLMLLFWLWCEVVLARVGWVC